MCMSYNSKHKYTHSTVLFLYFLYQIHSLSSLKLRQSSIFLNFSEYEFNIVLAMLSSYFRDDLPSQSLEWYKETTFSTNHLADTDKTKHNYNQQHKNLQTMAEESY